MFISIKLKRLVVVAVLCFSVFLMSVGIAGAGSAEVFLGKTARRVPVYSVDVEEKLIALSFDAAYGADKTSAIMDILEGESVSATFFLVGFWVRNFPDKAREIAERGFEIGTHSDVHGHMSKMTSEAISNDLKKSKDKIREATGRDPSLFRAPYGEYNDRLITVAEELGLTTVQWSVDSLDWKNESKEAIVNRIKKRAHAGAIILMHNNSDYVTEALPDIIAYLKADGYKIVPVGELIYRENYYIDNNGVQHRK